MSRQARKSSVPIAIPCHGTNVIGLALAIVAVTLAAASVRISIDAVGPDLLMSLKSSRIEVLASCSTGASNQSHDST